MTAGGVSQTEAGDGVFDVAVGPENFSISKDDVSRALGYSAGRIDDHFSRIIDDVLIGMVQRCEIRAGYRVLDTQSPGERRDGIVVGERFFTTDRIVAAQLRNAEQAALFACTIGAGMETWSHEAFRESEPVQGHFIDTVASIAVEQVAGILHDHIVRVMAARGLKVTNRFSPGYCGWPVAEQRLLFSLFPDRFCGITLTDSSLMVPVKSVSGIIGIGAHVEWKPYFCDRCSREDCTYRNYRREQLQKEGRI